MSSITGFKRNDIAVNDFNQKVKIVDISRCEIVFAWIDEDKVDVLSEDEFDRLFRKIDSKEA